MAQKIEQRTGTDWEYLARVTDEEIEVSLDEDERGDFDFENAVASYGIPWQIRLPKTQLTVRYDADVVEFFKATGKGYQSRMNAVLRAYVDEQKRRAKERDAQGEGEPIPKSQDR